MLSRLCLTNMYRYLTYCTVYSQRRVIEKVHVIKIGLLVLSILKGHSMTKDSDGMHSKCHLPNQWKLLIKGFSGRNRETIDTKRIWLIMVVVAELL